MKKLILIIAIPLSIGCNSQLFKDNSWIIGNWTWLGTNSLRCFACPEMTFGQDGSGSITKPSGEMIRFTYVFLSGNKIEFSFDTAQSFMPETRYSYYLKPEEDLLFLELQSLNKKRKYVLASHKQKAPNRDFKVFP